MQETGHCHHVLEFPTRTLMSSHLKGPAKTRGEGSLSQLCQKVRPEAEGAECLATPSCQQASRCPVRANLQPWVPCPCCYGLWTLLCSRWPPPYLISPLGRGMEQISLICASGDP